MNNNFHFKKNTVCGQFFGIDFNSIQSIYLGEINSILAPNLQTTENFFFKNRIVM